MKLNLASGTDLRAGWLNLDIVKKWPTAIRECDIIWDARKDALPFSDNSADEIYAGYLLLHLAPIYHAPVLKEIRRVLIPGAPCYFSEVDFEIVMPRWLNNPEDRQLSELIWGEQGERAHGIEFAEYDKHCWGFTESKLHRLLMNSGFIDIDRITVHAVGVFYELTMRCFKGG